MNAKTIWLFGLCCSGKTTIAKKLTENMREIHPVIHLDGDIVRTTICSDLSFSEEDRLKNITRIAQTAQILNSQGINCVCSFVTPLESYRSRLRDIVDNLSIVYVDCPLKVCIERDVKGMYAKAIKGEMKSFTGISAPFDVPKDFDYRILSHLQTVDESCSVVNINMDLYPINYEV